MLDKLVAGATDLMLSAGVKIVVSVIILIVGFRIIKWLMGLMKNGRLLDRADPSVKSFVVSFCSVAFKTILIITVAAYIGVPMTSMITLLGSACVAIGLALQGGLSNIASGILIIIFRPLSVGDYIECGDKGGTVLTIGMLHTTLNTPDNVHIVIPNSLLTSQTLVNYSSETRRRLDLDFTVDYDADIDRVKSVLLDVAKNTKDIMDDPAPEAVLFAHGDSALVFKLRAWCPSASYWDARFKIMEDVKRAFDREKIGIPYPQLDVHLDGGSK